MLDSVSTPTNQPVFLPMPAGMFYLKFLELCPYAVPFFFFFLSTFKASHSKDYGDQRFKVLLPWWYVCLSLLLSLLCIS